MTALPATNVTHTVKWICYAMLATQEPPSLPCKEGLVPYVYNSKTITCIVNKIMI